jgi:exonuclease III
MTHIHTVASLNINGITNKTRTQMLEEFFRAQDIDIVLIQEVTCQHLALSQRYIQYVNIGTEKRGTAILVKDGILLTDIKCLPSGRGITAKYNGISVINIYAPSGAEKKQDREAFYNNDVPYLLPGHNRHNSCRRFQLCIIVRRCDGTAKLQTCTRKIGVRPQITRHR